MRMSDIPILMTGGRARTSLVSCSRWTVSRTQQARRKPGWSPFIAHLESRSRAAAVRPHHLVLLLLPSAAAALCPPASFSGIYVFAICATSICKRRNFQKRIKTLSLSLSFFCTTINVSRLYRWLAVAQRTWFTCNTEEYKMFLV